MARGGNCRYTAECAMYGRFSVKANLRMWQVRYCETDFRSCVRFQRAESGQSVADTLLPDGHDLAAEPVAPASGEGNSGDDQ